MCITTGSKTLPNDNNKILVELATCASQTNNEETDTSQHMMERKLHVVVCGLLSYGTRP
jgi:hypothetical protein